MTEPPHMLDHADTVSWLRAELDRCVGLAERTPPDLHIPSCPDWIASDLFSHLGTVHRWATAILKRRATERVSRRSIDMGAPDDGQWGPWLAEGARELMTAVTGTEPEEAVWSWGPDQHARWWVRRMLHETVVHDADAALALGEQWSIDAVVAADGICELLDNAASRLTWPDATPPVNDATVHLHATDTIASVDAGDAETAADDAQSLLGQRGEWLVTMADGTVTHSHGHAKGDAAVRGPVEQLMLIMNRRSQVPDAGSSSEAVLFGDRAALDALVTAIGH